MTAAYVLFGILIFGVLIAVHEFGHFMAAKLCNVKVNEFSIGMGPAFWKKQKGETLYALRAIPLGGYCAMEGEDGSSDDPRAFTAQKPWKRLLILCAGSFNNFLLGLIIIFCLYLGVSSFASATIAGFQKDCPYERADGLQVGDRFLSIDGHVRLENFEMKKIQYEGQEKKLYGFNLGYEKATLGVRLRHTWDTAMEFARMVWMGLGQLVHGEVGLRDLSGPVGIVDVMAETGEKAASTRDAVCDILFLSAFIAINLAIMNMLPIPALDGGRVFLLLVTVLIEAVTGKKLDPKYEAYVHGAGMVLLLGLMAVIMFNDVLKIFQ